MRRVTSFDWASVSGTEIVLATLFLLGVVVVFWFTIDRLKPTGWSVTWFDVLMKRAGLDRRRRRK